MDPQPDETGAEAQLADFLAKYDEHIQELTRDVRSRLQRAVPGAVELVYDNHAGLVIGFGASERPSEAVLSIAVRPEWVTLCFLRGVDLPDPHGILRGAGNQVRNVRLGSPADLDQAPVRDLVREAVARSRPQFDPRSPRRLIIRSVSAKQRPRRPKR